MLDLNGDDVAGSERLVGEEVSVLFRADVELIDRFERVD
jgi:hypothetical protein